MKSLFLTVVLAVMIVAGPVMAVVEETCADDSAKPCSAKDVTCDKAATCEKDCSKCPDAATCEKKCPKTDNKCAADCTKPCCEKDVVMVTVNGEKVMQSVVDERIEPQLKMAKMMGQTPNEEMLGNFRKRVVEGMIRERLIAAKIAENKIKITDKDISAKLEEIAKEQGKSLKELIESASQQGYTEDKIKEQIKMGMGFEALMDAEAGKGSLKVTEEDAKKFYDANVALFSSPDLVKASHILAGGRGFDALDDAKKAEAKAKIETVQKKLKGGMPFEDAAKQFSDCPSKADGGDLKSYISADGMIDGKPAMDVTFSAAAHTLKVGEYGDAVKTPFGYHIIKCTDKKVAEVKTFADVKDEIIAQQEGGKKNDFAKGYIDKLVSSAKIVYPEVKAEAKKVEIKPATAPAKKATPVKK